jgi:hypothetical protein
MQAGCGYLLGPGCAGQGALTPLAAAVRGAGGYRGDCCVDGEGFDAFCGAAIEVGDEHWIVPTFPLEIGSGDQFSVKFVEATLGFDEFVLGGIQGRR